MYEYPGCKTWVAFSFKLHILTIHRPSGLNRVRLLFLPILRPSLLRFIDPHCLRHPHPQSYSVSPRTQDFHLHFLNVPE